MTRFVNALAAAVALAVLAGALPAAAQVVNALDRQAGRPSGLALPVPGVAVAEEPAATGATPAAAGFVGAPALQWFHEGDVLRGSQADGLYAATGVGPLGAGYSIEWVRPGDAPFPRFRKNTLSLTAGDHHVWSLGFSWNRYWSSDAAVASLQSWSAGLTVRPTRWLSVGAATLERDAWLGGTRLPSRYDLGLATRLLSDSLTLSADLLADDRARDDFHPGHLAFGAQVELRAGFALGAQILVPVREVPGLSRDPSYLAVASWNAPHAGLTAGVATTPQRSGWLVGARASAERYPAPASGRRAPTVDVARELDPDRIPFLDLGEPDPYGKLLGRLAALADDGEVPAVAVRIDDLSLGSGRIEELRAALIRIGARKPVIAYLVGGATREYWLASAATAIAVPPGSAIMVNGIGTTSFYLRDALARGGIAFEVVAAGAYKSAPEPLVREGPSPAARDATNALLDDVYGRLIADLAQARRLSPDRVIALVDQGVFGSVEAKEAGLVDAVIWPDELEGFTQRVAGRALRLSGAYRPEPVRIARRWGNAPVVEVIRVEGTITAGRSRGFSSEVAGAESIVAQLRRAAADRDVKAIVLRVESPGGDGLASDLIWRAVVKARERKPVIASMGDYAASGGYLAAAAADVIVAEPSTLTGSIGVFVLKPELSGVLAKLGIARAAFARGELAQITSLTKPWTEKERAAAEKQVRAFYDIFVARVAEGRRLPRERIEAVAGGRVWTGKQAHERGLVDRLGSLSDALALAAQRARLAPGDYDVRRAAPAPGGSGVLSGAIARAARGPLDRVVDAVPELRTLSLLSEMGPVLALPVEWVVPPAP
jgi:protease-4